MYQYEIEFCKAHCGRYGNDCSGPYRGCDLLHDPYDAVDDYEPEEVDLDAEAAEYD